MAKVASFIACELGYSTSVYWTNQRSIRWTEIQLGGARHDGATDRSGIFIAVFAIAAMRNVNIGIVMFPVACVVGLWLADLSLTEVIGEFPLSILVLLVGVTYFFGIAHSNGTDRLASSRPRWLGRIGTHCSPRCSSRSTAVISAMGAPLGGLVMAPMGMSIAHKRGIDPMLMASRDGRRPERRCVRSRPACSASSPGAPPTRPASRSARCCSSGWRSHLNLVLLAVAYAMFGRRKKRSMPTPPRFSEAMVARGAALPQYGGSTLDIGDNGGRSGEELVVPERPTGMQVLTIADDAGADRRRSS